MLYPMSQDKSLITTIVVKKSTVAKLCELKLHPRETMNDVLVRIAEEHVNNRK